MLWTLEPPASRNVVEMSNLAKKVRMSGSASLGVTPERLQQSPFFIFVSCPFPLLNSSAVLPVGLTVTRD